VAEQILKINWPSKYEPSRTAVHVRNELAMEAGPEAVWAWLIRAALWPTWYPNSAGVRFLDSGGPDLFLGARFRWKTFGVGIESVVQEFVPRERIAWDGHGFGVDVYHAWAIGALDDGGAEVLTEETQNGWMARASNWLMPHRMHRGHQMWLERLREKAKSGPPPSA